MKRWLVVKSGPAAAWMVEAKTYDDAWAEAELYQGETVSVTYCDGMYCSECALESLCPVHR